MKADEYSSGKLIDSVRPRIKYGAGSEPVEGLVIKVMKFCSITGKWFDKALQSLPMPVLSFVEGGSPRTVVLIRVS